MVSFLGLGGFGALLALLLFLGFSLLHDVHLHLLEVVGNGLG